MRILMLGWEFPPFISGGLGTACYGLTKALDRLGHAITFVLPKAVDRTLSSHVRLLSPDRIDPIALALASEILQKVAAGQPLTEAERRLLNAEQLLSATDFDMDEFAHVRFRAIPSNMPTPYGRYAAMTGAEMQQWVMKQRQAERERARQTLHGASPSDACANGGAGSGAAPTPGFLGMNRSAAGPDYGGDLLNDVRRYADLCVALTRGERYDVIHAHDWLTFPAGMALARVTGIPLVIHVHSTEFDRSGENVNRQIYEIERRAMHSALRVITVSRWTRSIVSNKYRVHPDKIRVVWNGVEASHNGMPTTIHPTDRIVLYLGRITMQKGPEYFIQTARRVLEKIDNVKFIVAGSGDMATRMIELAAQLGIGHKVLFTGFLRGSDVDRAFSMADCYVMPSVSEPFGIAPLEAMSHGVPVIISKQSGVSEALTHVLKVDFWDIDEMANKIVAVLRHPPLRQTLRHHGRMELRALTWEGAAQKCEKVYEEAMESVASFAG